MKKPSRFIAVLCLLAALFLSACAKAPAEAPAEAAVTTAQTPTHSPTESHATDASAPEASAEISTDNGSAPLSLSGTRWNLNTIYVNGEEQRPSVRYGSVIRQTGAYITFNSDNTFNCVLGFAGCTGSYTTDAGSAVLHITTRYDGTSEDGESCDETAVVTIDQDAQTLSFIFNNAEHVFTID